MIKAIIVDDHRMFRESIHRILSIEKIAEILAEAGNGQECLDLLEKHQPDIILMDIAMPVMDGIETTKKVMSKYPGLKIIALSSFGEEKYYFKMIEAGAKGFILKNASISELEKAINEVAAGGSWFSVELLQKLIINISSKPSKEVVEVLSEREIEILKLICSSHTNEQIAEKIHLSYDTVKWHRANLLTKTGCSNTAGLVMYAIKNKIVSI